MAKKKEVEFDFPVPVLYVLKQGVIEVPYVDENGKTGTKKVYQGNWNLKDQQTMVDFWDKLFENEDEEKKKKNIAAKMDKFFIIPKAEEKEAE